jgi:excisionase family DNA binding protein
MNKSTGSSDGPLTYSDTPEVRSSGSNAVPLNERLALSIEEAGALLGISRDLAYDLVARHELPSIRLGRRLVVPRRALEDLLSRLTEAG